MANRISAEAGSAVKNKKNSAFMDVVRRISKNKSAMLGLAIFLILVVLAILAPYISPYDYTELNLLDKYQGPSAEHWFGTDELGRDILSRILYGGRYSLSIGVLVVGFALVIGMTLGALSGFYGGWVDTLIMRVLDVIQAIPGMLLNIAIAAALGNGFFQTIVALSIGYIPGYARMLRAQVMSVSGQEYVEAANSMSVPKSRIILKHVLPNAWSPLIVSATMGVANAILVASSLSFIGLGIQAPTPEWGAMLSAGRTYIRDYPHLVVIPGIFIMVTVLGLNMFGDALRDALDPKLKD